MRPLFIIFLFVIGAVAQMPPIEPGVSQELAKWRAAHYSDVRYELNLTLEKMSPVLKGSMEIRVNVSAGTQAPSPANAGSSGVTDIPIILDWRKIKGSENLSTISKVLINGFEAVLDRPGGPDFSGPLYSLVKEHLVLSNSKPGENVIKLDFTSPILTSGSAITRYIDKEDGSEYIYSLFVPSDASTAFPVFDQPDLKARFSLALAAPKTWAAVSNQSQELLSPHETNPRNSSFGDFDLNFIFKETIPISTYVFAFAAGPFAQFNDAGVTGGNPSSSEGAGRDTSATQRTLPTGRVSASTADLSSHIYVRKSQAAKFKPHAAEVFRLNREAIKYFEQYFDYKFPFAKYDLVLIPEFPFGGMEHAGATFLRESAIIFPQEPTLSDHISRALLIFHEASHQWFGDTVTMKWFDDLWLKEGFATFTAYKALEKIVPSGQAWKVFYERVKQAAYQTDSTKGTTAIYQPIANLSAAKSAYGNIVYNKAPSFLRQAEFYLGEDKFQTAVRAFLKKNEFANAGWEDLVKEFEKAKGEKLQEWARRWVKLRGVTRLRSQIYENGGCLAQYGSQIERHTWVLKVLTVSENGWNDGRLNEREIELFPYFPQTRPDTPLERALGPRDGICVTYSHETKSRFFFPNYKDYGYGIFLLDQKSRDYVLKNIQNEKDPFLRSMMWGALWDSVREGELDPRDYVELAIKNLPSEQDETIVSSILSRVGTAMNYYLHEKQALAIAPRLEAVLLDRMQNASTAGQRITFFRALVNNASTDKGRAALKKMLAEGSTTVTLKAKDRFDIVTRLLILGDADAPKLLAELEKTETSDDAKRYAYAARAGIGTAENKAKYWNDFVNNAGPSESWIEAAFGPWNSIKHSELTLPYLQKALQELPNHKRSRKIFFVNGWLAAFIGGQRSEEALSIVNKILADNPNLDNDLRLKILENVDLIERAVRIRAKHGRN